MWQAVCCRPLIPIPAVGSSTFGDGTCSCVTTVGSAQEHPEHAHAGFCWKAQSPSGSTGTELGHASIPPACKITLHLQSVEMSVIGSLTKSIFMTLLFMLASHCSLPTSSQLHSFFHMEILSSLQIEFHLCQVCGAGAGFSQRSGPLAERSKCSLVTWGA